MKKVSLRRPREGDAQSRQRLGFHPVILQGYGIALSAPQTMSLEQAFQWVQKVEDCATAWIITVDDKLVGEVRLHSATPEDRRVQLAVGLVDPAMLGQGVGAAAIGQCLAKAFQDFGFHRVGLRVLASNTRAIICYQRCGFKIEGREKESAWVNDCWEDDVLMGMTEKDFVQA